MVPHLRPGRAASRTALACLASLCALSAPIGSQQAPPAAPPALADDLARVCAQAHSLLDRLRTGQLTLTVSDREGEQLRRLEREGWYAWPAPCAQPAARVGASADEMTRSALPSRGRIPGRLPVRLRLLDGQPMSAVPAPPSSGLLSALVT